MTLRTNNLMRMLFGHHGLDYEGTTAAVPEALMRELASTYEEIDGVVIPKGWANSFQKTNDDETGIECIASKIHIDAFLPRNTPLVDMVDVAMAYAHELAERLNSSSLGGAFRVIIGASPMDEESVRNTCVVRFHRIRQGQQWLNEDLEGYKSPIMTLDFSLPL
jgi:hypothetical protein